MICPLCRHRFEPREVACAPACPLARLCRALCCPNCHYQFVERSSIVDLVQRLAAGLRGRPQAAR